MDTLSQYGWWLVSFICILGGALILVAAKGDDE